jgi:hypothetical protein
MAENLNFFYYTSQIMIFIELPIVFFFFLDYVIYLEFLH